MGRPEREAAAGYEPGELGVSGIVQRPAEPARKSSFSLCESAKPVISQPGMNSSKASVRTACQWVVTNRGADFSVMSYSHTLTFAAPQARERPSGDQAAASTIGGLARPR